MTPSIILPLEARHCRCTALFVLTHLSLFFLHLCVLLCSTISVLFGVEGVWSVCAFCASILPRGMVRHGIYYLPSMRHKLTRNRPSPKTHEVQYSYGRSKWDGCVALTMCCHEIWTEGGGRRCSKVKEGRPIQAYAYRFQGKKERPLASGSGSGSDTGGHIKKCQLATTQLRSRTRISGTDGAK